MADKFTSGRIDTHEYVAKMKKADGDIAEAVAELESAIANAKGFAGDIVIEIRTQGSWIPANHVPNKTGLYRLVDGSGNVYGWFNSVHYYYYYYGIYAFKDRLYQITSSKQVSYSSDYQLDNSSNEIGDKKYYKHTLSWKIKGTVAMSDGTTITLLDNYPYSYLQLELLLPFSDRFTSSTLNNGIIEINNPSTITSEIKVMGNFFNLGEPSANYPSFAPLGFTTHSSPYRIKVHKLVICSTGLTGTTSLTEISNVSDIVTAF